MRISLRCKECSHAWEIKDEPRDAFPLECPSCSKRPPSRTAEDFSTALEDVLMQMWQLSQTAAVEVSLGTDALPERFMPPSDPSDPDWDE